MPAMLSSMHVLRPILSDKGAQAVVTIKLSAETATERRVAVVGSSSDNRCTEYMTMLLIPVSCWASITAITAMTAGRCSGCSTAPKIPTDALAAFGSDVGCVPGDASNSVSSSSATCQLDTRLHNSLIPISCSLESIFQDLTSSSMSK